MGFLARIKEKKEIKQRSMDELSKIQMFGVYKFRKGEKISDPLHLFFEEHPSAKQIVDSICEYETNGGRSWTQETCAQLLANGVNCVFATKNVPCIVVTPEMVLLWYRNQVGFVLPAPDISILSDMRHVIIHEKLYSYVTVEQPKEKSITLNAVAGAIIAGPVGAVVGAISAADKNAHATPNVKVTYLPSGDPFPTREEFLNPYKLRESEPRITPPDEEYRGYSINLTKCDLFASQKVLKKIKGQPFDNSGKLCAAVELAWGINHLSDFDRIGKSDPLWAKKLEDVANKLADGILNLIMVKRGCEYSSLTVQKELQKKGYLFRESLIIFAMKKLIADGKITSEKSDNTTIYKLI